MDEALTRLLGDVVHNMRDAVVVCAAEPLDAPGPAIIYVNPAFEAITGYSAAEIIGKTCRILQGPDTERSTLDRIRQALTERRSIRETVLNYRKDGTPFWAELQIDPIIDDRGCCTHWMSIQRPLQERRLDLITDLKSAAQLPGIVYSYVRSPDGRDSIPFASPEITELFGLKPEDVEQDVAPMVARVHPDDRRPVMAAVDESARTLGTLQVSFRSQLPNGRMLRLQAKASPSRLPDGSIRWQGYIANLDLKGESVASELRAVLDAVPAAVFVKDPESRIVLMNTACEEDWGISYLELRGSDGSGFFTDERVATIVEEDRSVFAAGVAIDFDSEFWSARLRQTRLGRTIKKPIYDAEGKPRFLVGITLDLSKQKQVEQELRASEERLRSLYEMSRVGFVLTNLDGDFVDLNNAFAEICGYPKSELQKLRYQDLTSAEYTLSDKEAIRELLAQGHCGPIEKQLTRKTGESVSVEIRGSLVVGGDSERYMWWLVEDIGTRKRQTEMQASLAAIVESSTDAIIGKRLDGTISTWNPAAERMFGYPATAALGRHISLIIPPDRLADEDFILERLRRGERIEQFETLRLTRDGHLLPVILTISPMCDEKGAVIGASKMVRDMTDRNRIEGQLRQSQKMEAFGNLTGGLAHDFNNLLGIIMGNLEMLAEVADPESESSELLADALGAVEHGAELTRSLLAFARRQPLQPKNLRLDGLIEDTVKLMRRLLGEHIEIVTFHEPGVCAVRADPTQLSAALTNLATNARDAMPNGGQIKITTGSRCVGTGNQLVNVEVPPGDYAVITISDTGGGIAPEIIGHIFEPFFTTKDRERGTGLGLSMVFGFIKQSGGHVNVYSEVGIGTSFTIYLPCTSETAVAVSSVGDAGLVLGRGETVLAVEDNEALRRTLVRQLDAMGYRVLEASGGNEALAVLEANSVDLLFSDVVMAGGMDGVELAHQVRLRWPETRILLASGFPEIRSDARLPVLDIRLLNKPYRKNDLASILREVFDDPPAARPL